MYMPNPLLIYGYKPRWVAELYRLEKLEKDNLATNNIPCINLTKYAPMNPLKTIRSATSADSGLNLTSACSTKNTSNGISTPTASADTSSKWRDRLYSV